MSKKDLVTMFYQAKNLLRAVRLGRLESKHKFARSKSGKMSYWICINLPCIDNKKDGLRIPKYIWDRL